MFRARPMLAPMGASSYSEIKSYLRQLYMDDPRPWLVGFSGGKDSTMLASLRPQSMAGRGRRNGPRQHLARRRVWFSNLIQILALRKSGGPNGKRPESDP